MSIRFLVFITALLYSVQVWSQFIDCVRTVHEIEWDVYQDLKQNGKEVAFKDFDVSKLNARQLNYFKRVNKKILGKAGTICKGIPFGDCFSYGYQVLSEYFPNKSKSEVWQKTLGMCKYGVGFKSCLEYMSGNFMKIQKDPTRKSALQAAVKYCHFLKPTGCVKFSIETETQYFKKTLLEAVGNAKSYCTGVFTDSCLQSSFELHMKGQKKLTPYLWREIHKLCRK